MSRSDEKIMKSSLCKSSNALFDEKILKSSPRNPTNVSYEQKILARVGRGAEQVHQRRAAADKTLRFLSPSAAVDTHSCVRLRRAIASDIGPRRAGPENAP